MAGDAARTRRLRELLDKQRQHTLHRTMTACLYPGDNKPCENPEHYLVNWADVLAVLDTEGDRLMTTCKTCGAAYADSFGDVHTCRDNCQLCKGASGGVRGNEQTVDGIVMCDYCHAKHLKLYPEHRADTEGNQPTPPLEKK